MRCWDGDIVSALRDQVLLGLRRMARDAHQDQRIDHVLGAVRDARRPMAMAAATSAIVALP